MASNRPCKWHLAGTRGGGSLLGVDVVGAIGTGGIAHRARKFAFFFVANMDADSDAVCVVLASVCQLVDQVEHKAQPQSANLKILDIGIVRGGVTRIKRFSAVLDFEDDLLSKEAKPDIDGVFIVIEMGVPNDIDNQFFEHRFTAYPDRCGVLCDSRNRLTVAYRSLSSDILFLIDNFSTSSAA